MTAYTAMQQTRNSRPIDSQSMTRAFNMSLVPLREQELAYIEQQAIDKLLRDTYIFKTLDSLDD